MMEQKHGVDEPHRVNTTEIDKKQTRGIHYYNNN